MHETAGVAQEGDLWQDARREFPAGVDRIERAVEPDVAPKQLSSPRILPSFAAFADLGRSSALQVSPPCDAMYSAGLNRHCPKPYSRERPGQKQPSLERHGDDHLPLFICTPIRSPQWRAGVLRNFWAVKLWSSLILCAPKAQRVGTKLSHGLNNARPAIPSANACGR
jgi:hypothetical protein